LLIEELERPLGGSRAYELAGQLDELALTDARAESASRAARRQPAATGARLDEARTWQRVGNAQRARETLPSSAHVVCRHGVCRHGLAAG